VDNSAEAGADAGSDLAIFRYDDAGNFLSTPFKIIRATGEVQMSGAVRPAGGVNVSASGSYSLAGSGSPEGVVTATVGSTFMRTNGGAVTSFYVKESGSGNTGWSAPYTTGNDINLSSGKVFKVNGTQVVGAQGAAVADASGGVVIDAEARTALNDLLAKLRTHGLIAT
jgi:hypothetical protein